jgi:hypothetical protein
LEDAETEAEGWTVINSLRVVLLVVELEEKGLDEVLS